VLELLPYHGTSSRAGSARPGHLNDSASPTRLAIARPGRFDSVINPETATARRRSAADLGRRRVGFLTTSPWRWTQSPVIINLGQGYLLAGRVEDAMRLGESVLELTRQRMERGSEARAPWLLGEGLGLRVDPVEILKDDEERLDLALPEQETLHGVQRSVVALRGLERLPPRILHRHVQEREEGRDSRLEGWIERQHLAGQLLPDLDQHAP
jgi:hypothetical protein